MFTGMLDFENDLCMPKQEPEPDSYSSDTANLNYVLVALA